MLRCLAIALVAAWTFPAGAVTLEPPPAGSEFQLFVENDMWAHTDRYYTNGIKFGIGAPLDLLQKPADWLVQRFGPDVAEGIHVGMFLGQNMYTPRNITVAAPQPYDRPWAAWLYLGAVAQKATEGRLDTAEFDLGLTGPAALGRQIQTRWHDLIGVHEPQGWANQAPSEPGFSLTYLQKRRYGNDTVDLVPHFGVTLGTIMDLARAGGIVRIGQRMTGFGPDTIEPGGAMLQGTRVAGHAGLTGSEWYLFAGVDHRYVAWNTFLDGPVFHDGPSVDKRHHVWDVVAGANFRYKDVRFSWTRVRRSSEFHTAQGNGAVQRFDSLNLGFEF